MRLTLRTLLAYLDDTLEPAQTRLIGQKVAESDIARQLVERIKQVTQRRRMSVPPTSGPDAQLDANTLAEYLDNVLPSEKLAEVEEICLASDVHLAEVSACHQILTIVLGQPSTLPPTAKKRMAALIKGHDPARKQRRPVGAAVGSDASGGKPDEADETLLMGLPFILRQNPWLRWAAPLAGVLLLGTILGVAVSQSMFQAEPAPEPLAANAKPDSSPPVEPKVPTESKPPSETKVPTPPPTPPAEIKPPLETKPVVAKPEETKPVVETKPPAETKPSTDIKSASDVRPPSQDRRAAGKYVTMGSVLIQKHPDKAQWQRVRPEATLDTSDTLMSLPGYRSEIRLDTGVHLLLWGTLPEQTPQAVLESVVVLHANMGFDLDFTLERGRVLLTNHKPNGPATVRVRFEGEVWDITLQDNQTEVVLQLWGDDPLNWGFSKDPRGEGPMRVLDLFVLKGQAAIKDGYHSYALPGPCMFYWHSIVGVAKKPIPLQQLPDWANNKGPLLQARVRQSQERLSTLLTDKTALDVALAQTLLDPEPASRILAVFCLGAIDDLTDLGDALDNEKFVDVRGSAIYTLKNWLNRGREQEAKLEAAIKKQYQGSVPPKNIIWLLHPLSEQDKAKAETYQLLIDYLNNSNLPIRELAHQQLTQLVPYLSKEIPYDPAGGTDQRERAYKLWKTKVPEGKLPPPPMSAK